MKQMFEMYVMVGAWISCKDSFSDEANHAVEDEAQNREEIEEAINMAAKYPDIVKIIAVGNEAMVTWQGHFVSSEIILKWVDVVLGARDAGRFSNQTLITCSDNWAALGGEASYRSSTLEILLRKLDFISVHTYVHFMIPIIILNYNGHPYSKTKECLWRRRLIVLSSGLFEHKSFSLMR